MTAEYTRTDLPLADNLLQHLPRHSAEPAPQAPAPASPSYAQAPTSYAEPVPSAMTVLPGGVADGPGAVATTAAADPGIVDDWGPKRGILDRNIVPGIPASALLRAVPDVGRMAGMMLWRVNQVTLSASLHVGDIVVRGAISGQSAQAMFQQLGYEAKESVREMLGVAEQPDPMPKEFRNRIVGSGPTHVQHGITLPDRLNALLDASADLTYKDGGHPAYVRLLSELAPDEARILRLFAQRGSQASVDVRTKKPFGVGSVLVAPGITMIGRYAGCLNVEKVPAYLNNMFRLGLVWFSTEPLPEQSLYDVLEAQEEVEEAMKKAGKGVTVRRSIELTAFGRNLCAMTGLLPPADSAARASVGETGRQVPPPDARDRAGAPS